jgi:hypothetical protein
MTTLLVTLTVIEILLVVAVLAVYLVAIARSLRSISHHLGLVDFGVRAIDTQAAPVGPSLRRLNDQLRRAAESVGTLAGDGQAARRG